MSFQEESTPGDQLIACNSAGQGELDSGTVSKRPIDYIEGSRGWGKGERTAGRMFGLLFWREVQGEAGSYFSFLRKT